MEDNEHREKKSFLDEDELMQGFSPNGQLRLSFPLSHRCVNNSFILSFISYLYDTCIVLVKDIHDA